MITRHVGGSYDPSCLPRFWRLELLAQVSVGVTTAFSTACLLVRFSPSSEAEKSPLSGDSPAIYVIAVPKFKVGRRASDKGEVQHS